MVQRLFGLTPTLLADTLTVQFTGGDRSRLRTVPELTVSVDRLRRAVFLVCCQFLAMDDSDEI